MAKRGGSRGGSRGSDRRPPVSMSQAVKDTILASQASRRVEPTNAHKQMNNTPTGKPDGGSLPNAVRPPINLTSVWNGSGVDLGWDDNPTNANVALTYLITRDGQPDVEITAPTLTYTDTRDLVPGERYVWYINLTTVDGTSADESTEELIPDGPPVADLPAWAAASSTYMIDPTATEPIAPATSVHEFMAQAIGEGTPTFDTPTGLLLPDYEGVYHEIPTDTMPVYGSRVVTNHVLFSDWSSGWIETAGTYEYGQPDPFGGNDAVRIVSGAEVSSLYRTLDSTPNKVRFSCWVMIESTTNPVGVFSLYTGETGGNAQLFEGIDPTKFNVWQRYVCDAVTATGNSRIGIQDVIGSSILFYGPQLEWIDGQTNETPSEYLPTQGSAVTKHFTNYNGNYFDSDYDWINNGTFDTDITPWTALGTSNLSWDSGRMLIECNSNFSGARDAFYDNLSVGDEITLTADIELGTLTNGRMYIEGVAAVTVTPFTSSGTYSVTAIVSSPAQVALNIGSNDATGTMWVDNVTLHNSSNPPFVTEAEGAPLAEMPSLYAAPALSNIALHSNDLTNAAWAKTTMTAALDATGLTGEPNTGSTLTATAGNATAIQTATSALGDHVGRFYLRRKTGTGVVEITADGTTWEAVVPTGSYQEFMVQANTTNPQVGIRIVTSGDEIEVGNGECYAKTIAQVRGSAPIVTEGSTVTNTGIVLSYDYANNDLRPTGQQQGLFYCSFKVGTAASNTANIVVGVNAFPVKMQSGTSMRAQQGSVATVITVPDVTEFRPVKSGVAYGDNLMKINSDGAYGNERENISWDFGGNAIGLLAAGSNTPVAPTIVGRIGDVQRWDLSYEDAQAKLDELME